MKKLISAFLALVLTFAFCACGQTAPQSTAAPTEPLKGLQVGFARMNITPEYSVPLNGYGNTSMRMSTGMLDYIYTTTLAISDGETTFLIIENDLGMAAKDVFDKIRTTLSQETGIPFDQIMIAVNHIHSGPDLNNTKEPSIGTYATDLTNAIVSNTKDAIADMKPATIMSGDTQVEGLNFVRHYLLEDGHVRGPNFGLQYDSPKVGHMHEADQQLQVISFQREGAEEIVLVNWQSHPQVAASKNYYSITADTIGVMRNLVESKRECKVIYVLGAAGDLEAISLIEEENIYKDHKEYGTAMGNAVLSVLNTGLTALEGDSVRTQKTAFTATVDKSESSKVAEARAIYEQWSQDNDFQAAVAAGEPYGINSPYHANGILRRSQLGDTQTFDIYALAIGEVGFVFAPYEMFCENGKFIKENSPFTRTIICSMANEGYNYISSAEGFDYNCYEANAGRYVKGTGEDLASAYVSLLTEIH